MKTYNSFTGRLRKGHDGQYRAVMKYSDLIMAMVPRPADPTFGLTRDEIEEQLRNLEKRAQPQRVPQKDNISSSPIVAFDLASTAAAYAELYRALDTFTGARWNTA